MLGISKLSVRRRWDWPVSSSANLPVVFVAQQPIADNENVPEELPCLEDMVSAAEFAKDGCWMFTMWVLFVCVSCVFGLIIMFFGRPLIVGPPPVPPPTFTPTLAPTPTPTPTPQVCTLEVPISLFLQKPGDDEGAKVVGTITLSEAAFLEARAILSPPGCAELAYRWFRNGQPLPTYDDKPSVALNPKIDLEQTIKVEIYVGYDIRHCFETSVKVVTDK